MHNKLGQCVSIRRRTNRPAVASTGKEWRDSVHHFILRRRFGPDQQLREIVVDARHPKIGLALKGFTNAMNPMTAAVLKLHDPQDEVLGFVQGVENLVARDRDGVRTLGLARS